MALRSAGKLAIKLAQTTGAFASGRSYVQRYFPPGYRQPATKLINAFEQAALGAGLYQVASTLLNDDGTPSSDYAIQKRAQQKPYKQYKTYRGRYKSKYSRSYNKRSNCDCRRKYRRRF